MNRIKKLREDRQLSQQEVAAAFDTTQQTYGRWESGHVEPPLHTLVKLAEYFDTTVDYLLERDLKNRPWI